MRSLTPWVRPLWRDARGSALVELALMLPVLLIIFIATVDFSRVFYYSMAITNAARAGAQYCSTSPANSVNTTTTRAVADNAAPSISSYASTATGAVCYCATDAGTFTSAGCTATCSAGSHKVATCSVTVTGSFSRATVYPGLPSTMAISRSATMRVND